MSDDHVMHKRTEVSNIEQYLLLLLLLLLLFYCVCSNCMSARAFACSIIRQINALVLSPCITKNVVNIIYMPEHYMAHLICACTQHSTGHNWDLPRTVVAIHKLIWFFVSFTVMWPPRPANRKIGSCLIFWENKYFVVYAVAVACSLPFIYQFSAQCWNAAKMYLLYKRAKRLQQKRADIKKQKNPLNRFIWS